MPYTRYSDHKSGRPIKLFSGVGLYTMYHRCQISSLSFGHNWNRDIRVPPEIAILQLMSSSSRRSYFAPTRQVVDVTHNWNLFVSVYSSSTSTIADKASGTFGRTNLEHCRTRKSVVHFIMVFYGPICFALCPRSITTRTQSFFGSEPSTGLRESQCWSIKILIEKFGNVSSKQAVGCGQSSFETALRKCMCKLMRIQLSSIVRFRIWLSHDWPVSTKPIKADIQQLLYIITTL